MASPQRTFALHAVSVCLAASLLSAGNCDGKEAVGKSSITPAGSGNQTSCDMAPGQNNSCLGAISSPDAGDGPPVKEMLRLARTDENYETPRSGGSVQAWARCTARADDSRSCKLSVYQRTEVIKDRKAVDLARLQALVIGRIHIERDKAEDLMYHLSTKWRGHVLDSVFLVVLVPRKQGDTETVDNAKVVSRFQIWGIVLKEGKASNVLQIGGDYKTFAKCDHDHNADETAAFVSCTTLRRIEATMKPQMTIRRALELFRLVANERNDPTAQIQGVERFGSDEKDFVDALRNLQDASFMEPAWWDCPTGCCTSGGPIG
jgi:hypothetical protein